MFAKMIRVLTAALALVGFLTFVMTILLATPLHQPPELKSITTGARQVDRSDLPGPRRFQARDGTELTYRLYEPAAPKDDRVAVLVHGSAGSSANMHAVAKALAAAGFRTVAMDIRGHGASGTRGDIGYIGQLDDDFADTVKHLRGKWPDGKFTLIGHSAGGGFALRVAGSANGDLFNKYILLAPYLDYSAPTSRPQRGPAHWAEPDIPRIIGIALLRRLGINCCEALPVLAFALPPESILRATHRYSYRLMSNFGTDLHYRDYLVAVHRPITVICGTKDELMDASRYEEAMRGAGSPVRTVVVPEADHMGILAAQPALDAIVTAFSE